MFLVKKKADAVRYCLPILARRLLFCWLYLFVNSEKSRKSGTHACVCRRLINRTTSQGPGKYKDTAYVRRQTFAPRPLNAVCAV